MANLLSDQDSGATEPIDSEPDPNPHGQVSVHSSQPNHIALVGQLKAHLAEHTRHLAATASYHGGQMPQKGTAGVTGQSGQGAFVPGGASGSASHQTSSVDSVGDCESGGANPD